MTGSEFALLWLASMPITYIGMRLEFHWSKVHWTNQARVVTIALAAALGPLALPGTIGHILWHYCPKPSKRWWTEDASW